MAGRQAGRQVGGGRPAGMRGMSEWLCVLPVVLLFSHPHALTLSHALTRSHTIDLDFSLPVYSPTLEEREKKKRVRKIKIEYGDGEGEGNEKKSRCERIGECMYTCVCVRV
ncbi:hypothetical protein AA313_de0207245 [Arthrobotrys entomopaga]|nr:hypothetical protein AA313_de0207245 [Arthrobotrys entomopaga]